MSMRMDPRTFESEKSIPLLKVKMIHWIPKGFSRGDIRNLKKYIDPGQEKDRPLKVVLLGTEGNWNHDGRHFAQRIDPGFKIIQTPDSEELLELPINHSGIIVIHGYHEHLYENLECFHHRHFPNEEIPFGLQFQRSICWTKEKGFFRTT